MREPPPDNQRGLAWLATFTALIVVAAFMAGKAARDAIFLSSFKVTSLPLFVGISAVSSLPIVLVIGKLMTRYGPGRLMVLFNLVSAAAVVVEWALLSRYPQPAAIAIFFHLSTMGAVLVSGFWSIVNERFDVQTAKRHIGRIGMGATLGGILGGVIAERTAAYLPSDDILLVLGAMQLVCAGALMLFRRPPRPVPPAVKEGTWSALGVVAKSSLLRNVAIVVVLGAVAACVMDYAFKSSLVESRHSGLLRSLAIYYTLTSIVTAVVQIAIGGRIIAWLGVPRSVSALPTTVTVFGALALIMPTALISAIARGAETVTRNSVYRAAYELLYAPLPEEHKRPTKVVLDVGAERVGDLLGAQIVGLIVLFVAVPRDALLIATVALGAITLLFALRLPRSYTKSLEESLMAAAPDLDAEPSPLDPWRTLGGAPTLGSHGDLTALSLVNIPVRRARAPRAKPPAVGSMRELAISAPELPRATPTPAAQPAPAPTPSSASDQIVDRIADLRSGDLVRIERVLATPLTVELAPHVLELVNRDDVARAAVAALSAIAPRCTGMLVDALLDPARDVVTRRRVPVVLASGEPTLARWGLWRGLGDPSFDVRYRCGAALSRLVATGKLSDITQEDVFATVKRELQDPSKWKTERALDDLVATTEDESAIGVRDPLVHVFTVLGLVFPAEPLRVALRAVQTDDPELRGTALEYLESILPADVRAQLWPFLEGLGTSHAQPEPAAEHVRPPATKPHPQPPARARRTHDELLAALTLAFKKP